MKVTFRPVEQHVSFELRDVDPALHPILEQCFWRHDDAIWHRAYPLSAPHLAAVMERFATNAEEMFLQLAYLRPVLWQEALLAFAGRAAEVGISWWLTGSVAACVRGVPLDPHDVDIMIDHEDAAAVADAFADVTIEPLVDTNGWLTRDFGVIFWHGRIDVASDPAALLDEPEPIDCGPYARQHLEQVEYHGYRVAVPPLHLQVAANRRRGRHARADLLQAHLDRAASRL